MHAGHTEEACAIATHICTIITCSSSMWLWKVNTRKSPKDAWAKVREVIKGKGNQAGKHVDELTAETFNTHYAAISTDNNYRAPRLRLTAPDNLCLVTEMDAFRMLDTLHPTATSLDQLLASFLRLGTSTFAAPLARLFHQSLATGVVLRQWITAVITPIPKMATPAQPSDFRPFQLCRFSHGRESDSSSGSSFIRLYHYRICHLTSNQFTFRPSGSTTAALVVMLHSLLCAPCWPIMTTSTSCHSIFRRRLTQSDTHHS